MNKTIIYALVFYMVTILFSCKQENSVNANSAPIAETSSPTSVNMKLWAEQVESSVSLTTPEDWSPEDWNNIFRNIDRKTIYADVVDAVLNGKQQAYNFFTDSPLTLDQVKSILEKKVTVFNKDSVALNSENKIGLENVGPNTISLLRVREKIWFDKEQFKLERKPTSLILYVNHYSEDGTFVGYQPLFYVKLNN